MSIIERARRIAEVRHPAYDYDSEQETREQEFGRGEFITGAEFAATITPEQMEAGRVAVAEFMACAYCSDGSCGDCTGTVLAVVRAMGFRIEGES